MSIQRERRDESDRVQLLDTDGRLLPDADPPDLGDEALLAIYEDLRLARHFDERAVSFQRQGRIGTYAPIAGQEGAQVASAHALGAADWLMPTYREHAAKLVRGMEPAALLCTMAGHGEGYAIPGELNVTPEYVPIATQVPQTVGMAWASRLQGEEQAFLCYLGDGATSEGDFHEGLNFAGVFDTPTVFFCNNNGWAISLPRERQTASATIAGKARAYGFEGVQVDGMDPLAVYRVTREAIEKAKDPPEDERRPTLIEAVQYRYSAHSTADDPEVYREGVSEEWLDRDPIPRFGAFLRRSGRLDDELDDAIRTRVEERVADAIEVAEAVEADPDELFEHVYAEPPDRIREQRAELDALRERHGDAPFRK
jgi:pyruvate dehydrogenase E1 component alpha subunit